MYPRKKYLLESEYGPQTQRQAHQQGFYENLPDWTSDIDPSVLERVSQQSPAKRRTWLARGTIKAGAQEREQARRAAMLAPMMQRQQAMQMSMPMGDREKLMLQQRHAEELQGGRQDFSSRAALLDMAFKQKMAEEGRQHSTEQADIAHRRGLESSAINRAGRMEDWRTQQAEEIPTPQYEVFQGPGGRQSYLQKGSEIPAGHQRVSPMSTNITIDQKPPPSAMLEKIGGLFDLQNKVAEIKNLYQAGGSEELGRFNNWVEGFKEKYQVPGMGRPTEVGTIMRAITWDLANTLLQMRSGAAISEHEYERLMNALPAPNMPADTFWNRLNAFEFNLQSTIASRQSVLGQSGYTYPTQETEQDTEILKEQLYEYLRSNNPQTFLP